MYTLIEKIPGVSFADKLLAPNGVEDEFVTIKFEKPADKKLTSIICSSGTTGNPKGVNMTHAQALSSYYSMVMPLPPFKTLNFSPMY